MINYPSLEAAVDAARELLEVARKTWPQRDYLDGAFMVAGRDPSYGQMPAWKQLVDACKEALS